MSLQDDEIDQLNDFLSGRLSEQERKDVVHQVENDREFKKEVKIYASILAGVDDHFDQRLKEKLKREDGPDHRRWIILAIAASLAVAIGAGYFFTKRIDPNEVFAKYYKPYYNVVSGYQRGMEEGTDSLYREAFRLYERSEYEGAINRFNQLLKESPNDVSLQFYLGLSCLATARVDSAIFYLRTVQSGPHKFAEPASWYLALCYLKANQLEEARATLRQISSDQKSGYKERATEILDDLE